MSDTAHILYLIASVLVFMLAYEVIVNSVFLAGTYQETASVWRSKDEMRQMLPWWVLHHALLATLFSCAYLKCSKKSGDCTTGQAEGSADKPGSPYQRGLGFGVMIGLFMGIMQTSFYPYLPIPFSLAAIWFVTALVEGTGIGLVLSLTCKKKGCTTS